MRATLIAGMCLTWLATASGDPTPATLGVPRFAQLDGVSGLPADSSAKELFMTGFRSEFAANELPLADSLGQDGARVPNRFRLLEGFPASDAWALTVEIGAPPPAPIAQKGGGGHRGSTLVRSSRGMKIVVGVAPPRDPGLDEVPEPPVPELTAIVFPPARLADPTSQPVGGGFRFPWADAGRCSARIALEQLHHRSHDLPESQHLSVAPAIRVVPH